MTAVQTINLAHGAGGRATSELIERVFLPHFKCDALAELGDAGILADNPFEPGSRVAMTTDGTVVTPLFFAGADIGKLAVNGTVNDLAVSGATPIAITASFILEEGLEFEILERVARSMAAAAADSRVSLVAGDTKVVPHGAADKLFISTAGLGVVAPGVDLSPRKLQPGDALILSGEIGNHGAAIALARGDLGATADIASDCRGLSRLTALMQRTCAELRCMRDVTRGGLGTVGNEWARAAGVGVKLDEAAIPIRSDVRGLCELLGLDPLYLANEGVLLAACPRSLADALVASMRELPEGAAAAIVGEISERRPGTVSMTTTFGGERMVDYMFGAQLPRIC